MTFSMGGANCPWCGYVTTDSTGIGDARVPGDGDVSICIECAGVSQFRLTPFGLTLVKPAEADVASIMADTNVRLTVEAIRMVQRRQMGGDE